MVHTVVMTHSTSSTAVSTAKPVSLAAISITSPAISAPRPSSEVTARYALFP
jgi:hypothetical protein